MSKNEIRSETLLYVDNAKEILSTKAGKEGKFYNDPKYIKMAGNTLWNGALLALDHKFPEIKKGKGAPTKPNTDRGSTMRRCQKCLTRDTTIPSL